MVLQRQVESNESPEVLQRPFTTRSKIYVGLQATNWSLKRQYTLLLALAALTAIQITVEAQHKSPELAKIEEKLIRFVELEYAGKRHGFEANRTFEAKPSAT